MEMKNWPRLRITASSIEKPCTFLDYVLSLHMRISPPTFLFSYFLHTQYSVCPFSWSQLWCFLKSCEKNVIAQSVSSVKMSLVDINYCYKSLGCRPLTSKHSQLWIEKFVHLTMSTTVRKSKLLLEIHWMISRLFFLGTSLL